MTSIDCSQLNLKKYDKGDKYVALSYVWGNSASPIPSSTLEVHQLPRLIQDAVFLTLSIGFKFLWVDRYCVSTDEETRRAQIYSMDQVYSHAEMTVVALKPDPSFGLPGVNGTLRRPQPQAKVGKYTFYSTLSMPQREIDESIWMTRAWTFQEAFLSRRMVFFTDEQMYFQCQVEDQCESVDLGRIAPEQGSEELPTTPQTPSRDWFSNWFDGRTYSGKSQFTVESLWTLIFEYSQRNLTFSRDYLNGMLGILRAFEAAPTPIGNHWGIPTVPLGLEHPDPHPGYQWIIPFQSNFQEN